MPPCSSLDTGRVRPLIYSPGVKSLNSDLGNHDSKVGGCIRKSVTNKQTNEHYLYYYRLHLVRQIND